MSNFLVLGGVGIAIFVVALVISIACHEWGHFFFARRFGMKATEFFIGFGPRIWSFKRGETEYGFKAIPAGAYVRILGMTPLEELDPVDQPRAFWRRKPMHRFLVLVAGSLTHFVIGIVLLLVLLMGVGVPIKGQTLEMARVSTCVPTSTAGGCEEGAAKSPAVLGGIKPGDRVTAFEGRKVTSWEQLTDQLKARGGDRVTVTVERGGKTRDIPVTLATITDSETGKRVGFLGVTAGQRVTGYETWSPGEAVVMTGQVFVREIGLIFQTLVKIPGAIPKLFSPERGETQGGQVGSVVGAGRMAGSLFGSDEPTRAKASAMIDMLQGINVFIGVFNLLPLLPMDGGHIAVLFWERIKAFIARKRGRPDPGPVDMTKLLPATYVVFVLLVGLGVLLIAADIVNPLASPF